MRALAVMLGTDIDAHLRAELELRKEIAAARLEK
jgi:hypothetical protein